VDSLRIERPDTDWDFTELTELHISEIAARGQIGAVFWVEPNGLFATYSALVLARTA
jgi:hypothetical protein